MQFPVEPIAPGFEARLEIAFPAVAAAALQLSAGELVAELRAGIDDSEVLFTARASQDTIEVAAGAAETLVTLILPAAVTAELAPDTNVLFDFVRLEGAGRFVIPGRWSWPVRRTVTRDV